MGADCSSLSKLSTSIHTPKMSRNERKFLKECLEKEHEFIIRRNVKKRLDEFLDALKCKMYKAGDTIFARIFMDAFSSANDLAKDSKADLLAE